MASDLKKIRNNFTSGHSVVNELSGNYSFSPVDVFPSEKITAMIRSTTANQERDLIEILSKKQKYLSDTGHSNKGRFCNNSKIDTLISKLLYVENKAKLSLKETQKTSSAVFIYNLQLRDFRFVLYR